MEDEVDVFHCFTTDGSRFLVKTYHLVYEMGSFSNIRNNEVTLSLCDIDTITKHSTVRHHSLTIHTNQSQEIKFKFRSKKIQTTVYDILEYRVEDTKQSLRSLLSSTIQQMEIPSKDVEIGKRVGAGSYGHVYKGKWNGLVVAVKRVKLDSLKANQSFQRELSCLVALRHPSCIQCYGVMYNEGIEKPNIIMEYCEGGSLHEAIKDQKPILYRWEYILRLFYDISRGMQYIHSKGIVHRDLKPDNIMICSSSHYPIEVDESVVKIVDFGISRFLSKSAGSNTICGTAGNFAPEVFSKAYSFPCDVFSFGVTMYKVLFKRDPFPNIVHTLDYYRMIEERYQPELVFPIPPLVEDILYSCLSYEPELRPNFKEVAKFFRNCMLRWQADPNYFLPINGAPVVEEATPVASVAELVDVLTPTAELRITATRSGSLSEFKPVPFPPDRRNRRRTSSGLSRPL